MCFFLPWSSSVTYVSQAIEEQVLKTVKRLIVGCLCPPWGRDGQTDGQCTVVHSPDENVSFEQLKLVKVCIVQLCTWWSFPPKCGCHLSAEIPCAAFKFAKLYLKTLWKVTTSQIKAAWNTTCNKKYLILIICSDGGYPLINVPVERISSFAPIWLRFDYFRPNIWRLFFIQFHFWYIFGD